MLLHTPDNIVLNSQRMYQQVVVTRINGTFADGAHSLTIRLGGALTPETQRALDTLLVSGDIVSASPREYVTEKVGNATLLLATTNGTRLNRQEWDRRLTR